MQELGNGVTVIGILVTLTAYLGQHTGVTLADLEPGLSSRWFKARSRVRRILGRQRTQTVKLNAAIEASLAMSAVGMVWSPVLPDDDLATRADKLERNLDSLRATMTELRNQDRQRFEKTTAGLDLRIGDLDRLVAQRHEESRRQATTAMRWEVRGLLITLVGAGLSVLG